MENLNATEVYNEIVNLLNEEYQKILEKREKVSKELESLFEV